MAIRGERFLLFALFSIPLVCVLSATSYAGELAAKKTAETIKIDGLLSESSWAGAPAIADFVQFEPRYGVPSDYKTVVKVLYDKTSFYVGIICYDPNPDKISAKVTKRDGVVSDDDAVAIILDTFNDNSGAYMFMVNSLGTQQDERWADNGRTRDATWDTSWQSAGRRNSEGWTAEIAIPFQEIRFDKDAKEWGFNAIRYVPRNLEMSHWTSGLTEWFRVSEYGNLTSLDFRDVVASKYTLIPYAQGLLEAGGKTRGDLGLDVRYNLSSKISLQATFNPDFATVEADVEQINLTRFELSYPEKRPFFLEGNENYSTRIRQFYSRRIGEIPWGLKLIGQSGDWKFNVLSTQSDPASANPSVPPGHDASYTAFRVGRELNRGSNIGLIGANRYYEGMNKGSIGMVGTFFFTDVLGMTTQVIRSYGHYGSGAWTYFFRPSYDTRTSHFHIRYSYVGDHVRANMNDIGFITDDNRREFDTNLQRRFWLNRSWIEDITPSVNYNQYWSLKGVIRSWELDNSLTATIYKKWMLDLGYTEEYKLFEKGYRNAVRSAGLKYDNKKGNIFGFNFQNGRNFDRDFDSYGAEVTLKLIKGWNLTYELKRVAFNPDPKNDGTIIHNIRSTYYLNKDLYFKVFYQSRDVLAASSDFAERRETLQCIFVWRVLPPFGQVQVAYLDGPATVTEASDRSRTLFVKISWVLQR